jgi:hypothetical protein
MADQKISVNFVKGTGIIDYPMEEILEFLSIEEYKNTYDKIYKQGKLIERVSSTIDVQYFEIKSPPMVSNRDFCVMKGVFRESPEKLIGVAFSVTHPD